MSNYKLNIHEEDYVNDFNIIFIMGGISAAINSKFKLNDILIRRVGVLENETLRATNKTLLNAYKLNKKYKVVYSKNGINYCLELNKKGKTFGDLICCALISSREHRVYMDDCFEEGDDLLYFDIDPDYVDSTILGDCYDPSLEINRRAAQMKVINDYNKTIRIQMGNSYSDMEKFIKKNMKVGYSYYSSRGTQYTVIKRESMTDYPILHIKSTQTGKIKQISPSQMRYIAIYSAPPRSMKELGF